ncbi:MAG: YlbF family regulator, partial [Anaeroplasmataceae bacterium]|nr:YlbF family regulator [Anaeroplasmataceae bacterium]
MDKLKKALGEEAVVKRIHELEYYIDSNEKLKSMLLTLKEIQKKMVNAKNFNQPKQYAEYKKEYDGLYQSVLD